MAGKMSLRSWAAIIFGTLVLAPVVLILILRLEGEPPTVDIDLAPGAVIGAREIAVSAVDRKSGLRDLRVTLVKDGGEIGLFEEAFPSAGFPGGGQISEKQLALTIVTPERKIKDGAGVLRVTAVDYSWRRWFHGNRTVVERPVTIDTVSPRIEVVSQAHNVNQGGAGLVIYRLSEPCPRSGVQVGEDFFPGAPGYFADPATYLAFFALDYRLGRDTAMHVTATDAAGNQGRAGFYHHIRKKSFKQDKIPISDDFLASKMPEFEKDIPAQAEPIQFFLKVNRDMRQANYEALTGVTQRSDPVLHWDGAFLRLPNSARRAGFADHREYLYNGELIDRQVHLGIDLASLAHSPVQAANAGRVAFTGDLGIYGQTVVIDHGFGLFSLYSHLSAIDVGPDQTVGKGENIGRTGSTGLAGGDHLHFGMMVHHVFVNPVEWWDGSWIKNNITDKIAAAGKPAAEAGAAEAAAGG